MNHDKLQTEGGSPEGIFSLIKFLSNMLFYLSLLERSSQYWIGLCSGQMVLIIEHDSDLVARQYTYGAMHNIWRFINLLAPDSATIFKGSGNHKGSLRSIGRRATRHLSDRPMSFLNFSPSKCEVHSHGIVTFVAFDPAVCLS